MQVHSISKLYKVLSYNVSLEVQAVTASLCWNASFRRGTICRSSSPFVNGRFCLSIALNDFNDCFFSLHEINKQSKLEQTQICKNEMGGETGVNPPIWPHRRHNCVIVKVAHFWIWCKLGGGRHSPVLRRDRYVPPHRPTPCKVGGLRWLTFTDTLPGANLVHIYMLMNKTVFQVVALYVQSESAKLIVTLTEVSCNFIHPKRLSDWDIAHYYSSCLKFWHQCCHFNMFYQRIKKLGSAQHSSLLLSIMVDNHSGWFM